MTDPIADMLTRIRNAQAVRKESVVLPYSKLKQSLADILIKEGYLVGSEKIENGVQPILKIKLKYLNKKPVISVLKRISKPGRRVYTGKKNLPYVLNNLGFAVISTSAGLMTNKQAKSNNLGGEVICEIY